MEKQYLSLEEQFKRTLNNTEITRIQDYELRKIRQKHWNYRYKILLDEYRISDQKFCRLTDIDYESEYKNWRNIVNSKGFLRMSSGKIKQLNDLVKAIEKIGSVCKR